jgi:hypothetical protein
LHFGHFIFVFKFRPLDSTSPSREATYMR